VTAFSFTRDGTRLATASGDHTVALWDPVAWRRIASVPVPEWVHGVALSPDGGLLAATSADGHLRVWRTSPLGMIHDLHTGINPPRSVVFTPDGTRMVVGTGSDRSSTGEQKGVGLVVDTRTGATLRKFEGHRGGIFGLALSPDGRTAATAGGVKYKTGEVKLWDIETGREVRSFDGHTGLVRDVAFSPDGGLLATASEDQTVRLWGAAGGETLRRIEVGNDKVHCLAFSRDGARLATGDSGGVVKLFDTATGDEILTLPGPSLYTVCLRFSPDGRSLLSGAVDRVIRVWEAGPAFP
jgi:WD40 repeat protein